jgi:gas vesicle protein
MINKAFEAEITGLITSIGSFDAHDFSIKSSPHESEKRLIVLSISMHGTPYSFTAHIPQDRTVGKNLFGIAVHEFQITIACTPGEMTVNEQQQLQGRAALIDRIKTWLTCVDHDIESTFMYRKISEQKEWIETLLGPFTNEDSIFTQSEAERLKTHLEEQQEKIAEQLREQIHVGKDLKNKLDQLQIDFEDLKKRIIIQSKLGWIRSYAGKLFKWGLDPKNQTLLLETVNNIKSLTDGTSSHQ